MRIGVVVPPGWPLDVVVALACQGFQLPLDLLGRPGWGYAELEVEVREGETMTAIYEPTTMLTRI